MEQNLEVRLLNAVRQTLISVAKDTMTKPGLRHPLSEDTQRMITDCLDVIISRQISIEKNEGKHSDMKPVFKDNAVIQSVSLDSLLSGVNKNEHL